MIYGIFLKWIFVEEIILRQPKNIKNSVSGFSLFKIDRCNTFNCMGFKQKCLFQKWDCFQGIHDILLHKYFDTGRWSSVHQKFPKETLVTFFNQIFFKPLIRNFENSLSLIKKQKRNFALTTLYQECFIKDRIKDVNFSDKIKETL